VSGVGTSTVVDAPPGLLPRVLPAGPIPGLAQHLARYGPPPGRLSDHGRGELTAEVERSGLTGRGGAGFPAARKLAAVRQSYQRSRTPVVVANGTEGEPASAKDKVLLARSPHLVLDGAAIAADLIGARRALIVVPDPVRGVVADAISERMARGPEPVRWRVITAAEGFVAGEASAVVHWISRGIPAPTPTPPRLAERGLHGAPTLVSNVETLAHLALIARYGADWFRAVGTVSEPGSMLVTILGAVRQPGVHETAVGTPVREVLDLAGGPSQPLRALLIGGYSGSWVNAGTAFDRPFSAAGLAGLGAAVGAGIVAALPEDACGLAETARVARYLAGQSAGQCGPCLFGLDAIAGAVEQLADGRTTDTRLLDRWLSQVAGRGACGHPDGVVRLVRSALTEFGDERERHASSWCCGRASVLPVPAGGLR
jgi:NADH:ubiquinone oxidoreductase subunit F (NADH-binding)